MVVSNGRLAPYPELQQLRNDLVQRLRSKGGKGKGKQAATAQSAALDSFDFESSLQVILSAANADAQSSNQSSLLIGATQEDPGLLFELLALLLQFAQTTLKGQDGSADSNADNNESIKIFDSERFLSLAEIIYSSWETGTTNSATKCKLALEALLNLADELQNPVVLDYLKTQISQNSQWDSKRTITIFSLIAQRLEFAQLHDLCSPAVTERDDKAVQLNILRRLLSAMMAHDETAVLTGKVSIIWIEKVWETEPESKSFWTRLVAELIIHADQQARNNLCLYFLPALFEKDRTAFKKLLEAGNFLDETSADQRKLEAALAILKVGNSLKLVEMESREDLSPVDLHKVVIPPALVSNCLVNFSSSLRTAAFSLVVISSSNSLALPTASFPLLRTFYSYSLGEEEGEMRMMTISLTGKLLIRLRDSAWKAQRKLEKDEKDPHAREYLILVKSFLEWFSHFLIHNLNPAKPFRIRINALRMFDLLAQTKIDENFNKIAKSDKGGAGNGTTGTMGYSTYRRTAPTTKPRFDKRGNTSSTNSSDGTEESAWPLHIDLTSPHNTAVLLSLLLSTYTALRALAISILEKFPAPLPGYEGIEGNEKAKRELLQPALGMVRNGREADASAGGAILGLVWRKWILEAENSVNWSLAEIGGWQESEIVGPKVCKRKCENVDSKSALSAPLADGRRYTLAVGFLNSLMDLADSQLAAYASDLSRAAAMCPMHGTILGLRFLLVSIPIEKFEIISTSQERRTLFQRVLRILGTAWTVTAPVLAAAGSSELGIDTEEARALTFEDDQDFAADGNAAAGTGGAAHKIILSACWRVMKEAGDLLETILRLPSESGATGFQQVWTLDDVKHIGDLYALWLAKIRHRGAYMALHPCYSRAASTLLACKDWPEVQELPINWLNVQIDSIVSKNVSTTRRSAGIPFLIVSLLIAILPKNKSNFNSALIRLFEIAESTSAQILDQSRVHAMNSLRACFLDGKLSAAVAPFVERGFLISVALFRSNNWICRNVAMMTFGSLILRAFGNKRVNLDRTFISCAQRLGWDDFNAKYPNLPAVLLKELQLSVETLSASNENLNVQSSSSLFSILMLLSLLQLSDSTAQKTMKIAQSFIPCVQKCLFAREWKIREVASDALSGLIPPSEFAQTCLKTLKIPASTAQNELHGRLLHALRLIQVSAPLPREQISPLLDHLESESTFWLNRRNSFSVRTSFLQILQVCAEYQNHRSQDLLNHMKSELAATQSWANEVKHLPSAQNFATALFNFNLLYEPDSVSLIEIGLESHFLEIQRLSLKHLAKSDIFNSLAPLVQPSLIQLATSSSTAPDCRIDAIELLTRLESHDETDLSELIGKLSEERNSCESVPVREVLVPLLAKLINSAILEKISLLDEIDIASRIEQSVESRESAARALSHFTHNDVTSSTHYKRILIRLLQDDDSDVRAYAQQIVTQQFSENQIPVCDRKSIEIVLNKLKSDPTDKVWQKELVSDLAKLTNRSNLLFAFEPPNIFRDDLLETELSGVRSNDDVIVQAREQLEAAMVSAAKAGIPGPLGLAGNEIVCKWNFRLGEETDERVCRDA